MVALASSAGCSSSVSLPVYSAANVANAAMAQYDTNKDGKLDEKELEHCPALRDMLPHSDVKDDKVITRDALETRLNELLASQIALMAVTCKVENSVGQMSDVTVTFIPEKFHGSALSSGSGKTDDRGLATIRCDNQPVAGLAPGFYRVELSRKDASGAETIPADYNVRSTLGFFVNPQRKGGIKIQIP